MDLADPDVVRALSKIHTWPLTLEICLGIHGLDFSSDPADEIIASTSIVADRAESALREISPVGAW